MEAMKMYRSMYQIKGNEQNSVVGKSSDFTSNISKDILRAYPVATNRLFSCITGSKRILEPGDWLSPNTSVHFVATSDAESANSRSKHPKSTVIVSKPFTSFAVPSCSSPSQSSSTACTNTSLSSIVLPSRSVRCYDICSSENISPECCPMLPTVNIVPEISEGAKKKKCVAGPSRQQEDLCLVCADRASGYHYNALTCEGCKGFFRRSVTKNAVYKCKYGNNCDIDMYMRRKCQECRLKKCLNVGMRPECVVPEYQCAVKRKEKLLKEKDKPNSTTDSTPEASKTEPLKNEKIFKVKTVSPEQEELIHSLVFYQEQYEQPSEEDLERVMRDVRSAREESEMKFRQITEMTILTVQLIVEFAKSLPGFDKLLREDQITLLKACSSEVMMFRMARKYDVETDSIVFANNELYTKDSYSIAGMGDTIDDLLRFCRQMCSMKVDNAEYALLTAIVIFSGRPFLIETWKVEKIQEIYIETLRSYIDNRGRPNPVTTFARLLAVLTELRTLGNQNSEMCFALKLKSKVLPPFLSEIWDIVP